VRDATELQGYGVGVAAIMPNDTAAYPDDSFENMIRFSAEHRLPFPYLIDRDQSAAKSYGAVCTPDFFGFDADLGLQYRGRLDSGTNRPPPAGAPRELFEAMKSVARTGKGPAEQIPSMGCSIKWKGVRF
jgi:hypothetical protein